MTQRPDDWNPGGHRDLGRVAGPPVPSAQAPYAALIEGAAACLGVPAGRVRAQFDRLRSAWPVPLGPDTLVNAGPGRTPRLSTLTPSGVPLELAATLGGPPSLRYILDPSDFRRPGPERAWGSAHLAGTFLSGEARAVHDALRAAALRAEWLSARAARFGVWLAPQHWPDGREVLRVYYNLAPLRWAVGGRLRPTLERLAPALPFAPPPLTAVVPAGLCLAMLGMEVNGGSVTKLKWYFRACRPVARRELGRVLDRAGLGDQQVILDTFWTALMGETGGIPERQGVLYVSGDRGGQPGVNVYVNAALLGPDDAAVARRVHRTAGALGLDSRLYAALLAQVQAGGGVRSGGRRHTLTGLGVNARTFRLNQYLCPGWEGGAAE